LLWKFLLFILFPYQVILQQELEKLKDFWNGELKNPKTLSGIEMDAHYSKLYQSQVSGKFD